MSDRHGAPSARASGHRARTALAVERSGDRQRVTSLRCEAPLTFRATGSALTWVGTAAGPIGGDALSLSIRVGPTAGVVIDSVAAAIVLPGPHGLASSMRTDVDVGNAGSLTWVPEPTIVAARSDHVTTTDIHLGADAEVWWQDVVVLGRHGESPGTCCSTLRVDDDDGAVVRTTLAVGAPGWDGPAVLGRHRAVGQVFAAGAAAHRLACAVDALDLSPGPGGPRGLVSGCSPGRSSSVSWTVAGPSVADVCAAVGAVRQHSSSTVPVS